MTIPGQDPASRLAHKHVVHENVVGGSSVLRVFPFVIAVSEWDMPGIEPGPLGWYTRALTTGLQEVRLVEISLHVKFHPAGLPRS